MKSLLLVLLIVLPGIPLCFAQLSFSKIEGLGGNDKLSRVLSDQDGILYAVAEDIFTPARGTIYRSQNGGLRWQKLNFACNYLRVAPNGTLFGIKSSQLYRSVNQGQSWTALNTSLSSSAPLEITPTGALLQAYSDFFGTYNFMYRSTDAAASWTQTAIPFHAPNKIFSGSDGSVYAFVPIHVGSSYTTDVYRSMDDGQSWQPAGTCPGYVGDDEICFQTQSGRLMILRDLTDGFSYSDDHGASWTQHPQSSSIASFDAAVSIIQTTSGRLWLLTTTKRFYSDNDGQTWNLDSPAAPDDPLKGLFITPDGIMWGNFEGALYHTQDATLQTWTYAADGMKTPNVQQIEVLDETTLIVCTTGGLFRSHNGGGDWTHFYQEPVYSSYDEYDHRFCIDQQGNIVLADGFKVWRIDPMTGARTDISPGGQPDEYNPWSAFCLPGGALLVGNLISHDNGTSWHPFVNSNSFTAYGVAVAADTLLYISSEYGDNYAYNPVTFAAQPVQWNCGLYGAYPFILGPSGSIHGCNYKNYGVSYDFGASWECYDGHGDGQGFELIRMVVNSAGHIYVSDVHYGGYIYQSVDGGQSWNTIYGNSTTYNSPVTTMRLAPSGRMYMAVAGKGLYRSVTSTTSQKLIKGAVFNDTPTADCDRTTTEEKVVLIKTQLRGNGTTYVGISNLYGQYTMPAFTGQLTAEAIPPSNYWTACQKTLTVPANATGIIDDSLALGLQPLVQCPKLEVSLSSPFLRRCFESYLVVDYCNTGTLPATNATVKVMLDSFFIFTSAEAPLLAQNGQKLTFQIGDVAVNRCGKFRILVTVSCAAALGQAHCSVAHIYPDQDCAATWTGAWLETSATCTGEELFLTIHNRGAAMQTSTDYAVRKPNAAIIEAGTVQLPADGTFTLTLPASSNTVFFSVQQEATFPYGTFAGLLTGGCASTDSSFFVQPYADNYDWEDEECMHNVGSFDPNDKSAFPPGLGEPGYLPRGQTIEYQVRFQNTGTDTAFTVVVRDQISPWLDLTTIRPVASSHPYLVEINGQELVFRFPRINLPDSNINAAASHGFLRFTIVPRAEAPNGTEITNKARIYFDFNSPVITNTTRYRLGLPDVTGTKESYSLPTLLVSPNPSSGPASVELPASIATGSDHLLFMTDMAGREVHRQHLEAGKISFHLPYLAPGLYLLAVRTERGSLVAAGKWVKQ